MSDEAAESAEAILNGVEESLTGELGDRFREKEPDRAEKEALLRQHERHLVRNTRSRVSVAPDLDLEGMEAEAEIEVPDTYCQ